MNLDLVNIYFNSDMPIPRDDGCAKSTGWTWSNDSRTDIQFCEEACEYLNSGEVLDINIEIMCTVHEVNII